MSGWDRIIATASPAALGWSADSPAPPGTLAAIDAARATAGPLPVTDLITSCALDHPEGRRTVLAVGRTTGRSGVIHLTARWADLAARAGEQEQRGIHAVREAGRQARRTRHGQEATR